LDQWVFSTGAHPISDADHLEVLAILVSERHGSFKRRRRDPGVKRMQPVPAEIVARRKVPRTA
jgi:hypothetical protein